MKKLLTLAFLTVAIALPAASPYTLEAPPGQHTNTPDLVTVALPWERLVYDTTTEINPAATAALVAWDKQFADKQFAELNMKTNGVPGQAGSIHTVPITPPPVAGKLFVDTFTSISTPDFSHGESWSYGLGVGYAFDPRLSASLRVTHAGLNFENNAISTVGGRLESRLPWQFLSPYGFVGAAFDLGPDQWRLQPGVGIELGVTKLMKGLSIFAEGGPDVDLRGHSTWLFSVGGRWRF